MTTSSAEPPKTFISYTHDSPEHMDRVLELANRLRDEGVDCRLDQYETSPGEGWPRWTAGQIEDADYVLTIFTGAYQRRFKGSEEGGKGRGAQWEGAIITQELYDAAARNDKFLPVLFSPEDSKHVPHVLRGVQAYDLSTPEGYTELYRRLTNQPRVTKPELGGLVPLPTRGRKQFFFNTWNIPYTPNPFFTGREDALAQLRDALDAKGVAATSGMPGVGKTQTAVEYAHRHRSEYKLLLWARADTRETLTSDFVNVAGTLQLPEVRAQEQSLAVGAVRRWFDANADWLLVLDNADDLALAREFMPAAPKGHIILTTRAQATGAIATNVDIFKMEEDEGALFLLRRAKILAEDVPLESAPDEDRRKAGEITREVDGLPLALDQAGAFIEESSSSPAEYLELYKTQGADLRRRRGAHVIGHPESVEITFTLSFDKVAAASPTAADLLRACAFLAPDLIPEEIFNEGGSHLGDLLAATANNRLAFIDTVTETLRYSLLRRDANARTFSVHRIVQDVLKDAMDESTQRQWAERIIKAVNHVLPEFDENDYSEWHYFERLLPHTQVCAALIEKWDLQLSEAAHLLNNIARYLHNRAVLTEVEALYIRALNIRKRIHEHDHLDVAESLHNLGWLKEDQAKYVEAEVLHCQALEIRRSRSGSDSVIVARSNHRMGWLKAGQGKYTEARAYFSKSIETLSKSPDISGGLLADSLTGLGNVFYLQGKYKDAESMITQSLEIKEKTYGTDYVFLTRELRLLGSIHKWQGHDSKAEALYLRARNLLEGVYGTEHPALASTLNNLAGMYADQQKFSEAEVYALQALAIVEKVFGEEHPTTGMIINDLALLYKKRGDLTKAEELYRRACDIIEKTSGSNHPGTAIGLLNLAVLYTNQRRFSEAEPLFRRARMIQQKTLPPGNPDLLNTLEHYAELLRRMNRKGEAQELADQVRKARAKQGRKKPKR